MSTTFVTFDRMLSVVTLDVLAVPIYVNDVGVPMHFHAKFYISVISQLCNNDILWFTRPSAQKREDARDRDWNLPGIFRRGVETIHNWRKMRLGKKKGKARERKTNGTGEITCFWVWENSNCKVKEKKKQKQKKLKLEAERARYEVELDWNKSKRRDRKTCSWQNNVFPTFNPLECEGNYSVTSNNMKLVHWLLSGGLLHLIQRGGDWAGLQPAQTPPRCTKCVRHCMHDRLAWIRMNPIHKMYQICIRDLAVPWQIVAWCQRLVEKLFGQNQTAFFFDK